MNKKEAQSLVSEFEHVLVKLARVRASWIDEDFIPPEILEIMRSYEAERREVTTKVIEALVTE